ncbi:serine/threonine-protein kinase SBK1-like [Dendropsophus ebraccatus]|uniref:serine/threonine-protein kinase SBK1-like n=1 Tax=Dendropsophus ebraccatus TaxID=150705 RepID=UPI003831AEB9
MASSKPEVQSILESLVSVASRHLRERDLQNTHHIIRELGQGGFGSVLMVKEKKTGQEMALKLLHRKKTAEFSFLMELSVSFFLSSHPNIIRIYGVGFKTGEYFGYTQELATHGDLFDLISPDEGLPEEDVKRCAIQISSALDFMEGKGLVHLDIKPENILVFEKDCHLIKITDFGLSQVKGFTTTKSSGTTSFMAPEMRQVSKQSPLVIDSSLDVWSFGVLLYILLTGEAPWQSADPTDQEFCNFVVWQKNFGKMDPPSLWRRLPPGVLRMFSGLLDIDYKRRSKCTEVLIFQDECWKEDFAESDGAYEMENNSIAESGPADIYLSDTSTTSVLGVESCYMTPGSCHGEEHPDHGTDINQSPLMFIDEEISVYVGAEVEIE